MIDEINIRNFALVEKATLSFGEGFNVITGETGAGKSLMAASLSLLRGGKGEAGMVRNGTEECEISGYFYTENREALSWLSERGIEPDEGAVLIRRTVKKSGRGSIQIQGHSVTRDELAAFTGIIFDAHGQHEQYTLVNSQHQLKMVDSCADIGSELSEMKAAFDRYSNLRRELEALDSSSMSREREADILAYAVKEIKDAGFSDGDEEELERKQKVLSGHDRLCNLLKEVSDAFGAGGLSSLRTARISLEQCGDIDPDLAGYAKRTEELCYEAEDIAEGIRDYISGMSYSPEELELCQERLWLLGRLKKKYGKSIKEILDYAAEAEARYQLLSNYTENREKLVQDTEQAGEAVRKLAALISEKRKKCASVLEKNIEGILRELGMPKASFRISVEQGAEITSSGSDIVSFLISPNQGEPLRPVSQAVSGGELSRIMLAVKSAFSGSDPVESMLFDEIDAGIGGEVAVQLGKYLSGLSEKKQVICITHLASIAVKGDNHIRVVKKVSGERTCSEAAVITGEDRVNEIARMLSGTESTISAAHARTLLEENSRTR